jgi:hypothetical protein
VGPPRRAFTLSAGNGKGWTGQHAQLQGPFQKEKNARQGFWEDSQYEKFRDALPIDERGSSS